MKKFSTSWVSSKKPRKQRNYRERAPLHIRGRFLNARLADTLSKKYQKRSARVRKGDKVTVLVGQFKGKSGKVENVDTKNTKVFIAGIESQKKDGSKMRYPINPSNVMITELNLDDKKRQEILKRK